MSQTVKTGGNGFRAGVQAAILLMFGVFSIFIVVNSYALAQEWFLAGSFPSPLSIYALFAISLFVVGVVSEKRVLHYALSGLWLSAGSVGLYVLLMLGHGAMEQLSASVQLALVLVIGVIVTLISLRARSFPLISLRTSKEGGPRTP